MIVIANLYGKGDVHSDKARDEYREIKMNVLLARLEGERSYTEMFRRYYKRVFIAMSAQAMAQLNGINVISYYAPLVFQSAGWVGRDAILMTGINALSYLASTVPPWYLVDRWGRRPILLSGAIAMLIALSLTAYFIDINIDATPTLTVICVMVYNAAFGASWGPVPWLYPPEILPLSIRAKGASLSTAANWAFNFLVGEVTPVLQDTIQWRLYLVHAFFCACSFVLGSSISSLLCSLCFSFSFLFVFLPPIPITLKYPTDESPVYFLYPETSGVRLEDMDQLFGDAPTMQTPITQAERGALIAGGSPPPSFDLRRGPLPPDSSIPPLDIEPPEIPGPSDGKNGEPASPGDGGDGSDGKRGEGLGGWISNMVGRSRDRSKPGATGSQYQQLNQDEEA
jgi:hypothetical protein